MKLRPPWQFRAGFFGASLALFLQSALFVGCAGGQSAKSPEETLREYATALREGDAQRAYALLSQEARRTLSFAEFERMLKDNSGEIRDVADALSRPTEPLSVTAVVTSSDGETLHLVYEDGAWKADVSAVDLYSQSSPRKALEAFIRAFEARRYDVLMRFVPVAKSDGLSAERLKEAWEGDQKEEMESLIKALRHGLPHAQVEILGSRATVAYGPAATVQLLEENGAWKVEEF